MRELWLDLETRSRIDLKKSTPYRYAEHPSFSIHMCSWTDDGVNYQTAVGHEQIADIPYLWSPRTLKIAHNAPFERICLSRLRGLPVGEYLPPEQYHDTAAVAGQYGYPQDLATLARVLGCTPKDTAGTRLINLFCKPNRKGEFNRPEDYPAEWLDFIDYCEQDVETLFEVDGKLGRHITPVEEAIYLADQAINDAGLPIDRVLAEAAVSAAADNAMVQEVEFSSLTGVHNPNSNPQLMAWCRRVGLPNQDMQAETIEGLLEGDLPDDVRRALLLRQELALVAAKKFASALYSVNADDRLRGTLRYFGAHTGRWSGKGAQPQNLPRATFTNDRASKHLKGQASEVEAIMAILDLLETGAASAEDLKRLVRAMFLPNGGTVFDYASIEARVIAWFAPEEWALQAFRDGRDIYVETANRMGGLTRDQGKVAVLALGFAGGINSLRNMGAEGDDDELKRLVYQWRRANPHIVDLWDKMSEAMENGGQVGPHLHIEAKGTTRMLHLPSGRAIYYHDFKWERYRVKDPKTGKTKLKEGWRYRNPRKGNGPVRIGTYGGRMTENAVQGVARDVMAETLVRLLREGFIPVGHVHDEVLIPGYHDIQRITEIATVSPAWATDMPIDAEAFNCFRYRKG